MILFTICLSSLWALNGYAERLYSWVDDKGVVHISQKPPPQSAELIDIMDYKNHTAPPANQKQADQKQQKDLSRTDAGQSGKASDKTGTGEDIEEDVYYDSRGNRYTRRERKQERKERRQEDGQDREKKGDSDPDRKDRYREDRQERKDSKKTEKSERQEYLQKGKESKSPGRK
jgi:hypothetical protein